MPAANFAAFRRACEADALALAMLEDVGQGDLTTEAIIPSAHESRAVLLAKSDGVVAGLRVARLLLSSWSIPIKLSLRKKDGERVKAGDIIGELSGRTNLLLVTERTLLNLLQRMSGIATKTAMFVEAIKGTKAKILDTRKTAPGLRYFDKEAVKLGGGANHRFGLYDMILIKDNHIDAAGGVGVAIERAKAYLKRKSLKTSIEVEVRNLDELREAIAHKPNIVLLDNFSIDALAEAVRVARSLNPSVKLEASGGVTLSSARAIAETGVDFISVGELTHSVTAMDISMKLQPAARRGKRSIVLRQ
ncbi:MAG: carboxylating nicotinate-nucleotide diphosphorylase [Chloroherpetonaceae bacterium]|nr:carboxylating nicotinate-nucleotide diphosphorylase [Chloroherpetonaceae bacterium]MDW8436738.1 carboxylating nicotinate-nucleotide diphosphorylase [Chloroherpetonaceae bacterium]